MSHSLLRLFEPTSYEKAQWQKRGEIPLGKLQKTIMIHKKKQQQ